LAFNHNKTLEEYQAISARKKLGTQFPETFQMNRKDFMNFFIFPATFYAKYEWCKEEYCMDGDILAKTCKGGYARDQDGYVSPDEE
jgi:hypothetical protein